MFFFSTENLFLSLLRQSYADYLMLDIYLTKMDLHPKSSNTKGSFTLSDGNDNGKLIFLPS